MDLLKTFLPYVFGDKVGKSFKLPQAIDWGSLSLELELTFKYLQGQLGDYKKDLTHLSLKEFYHLLNFYEFLPRDFRRDLKHKYFHHYFYFNEAKNAGALNAAELQEIFDFKTNELSVFVIMHPRRHRPGKLFIRDANGDFVKDEDGNIWSIPVLARSRRKLPFNHSNGNTPQGVMKIESVMPEANKQAEFGQFRRLIVNFLGKAESGDIEVFHKIPRSHHSKNWWKQAQVARDLGRSLIRIHGSGERNYNFLSYHFPMIPSSGCLTTREFKLLGREVYDQRKLLDKLMSVSGLTPCFENEVLISGLLYVIDFDGTYQELKFK